MKKILITIALLASVLTQAQVKSVSLQASGLTCSMCSNSITKALKSLSFVQAVESDIKTYTYEISFNPNSAVDFDIIRKKVEAAGFAVSAFIINIHFPETEIKNDQPVVILDKTFVFVNTQDQVLTGDKKITVLDKGFVTAKEFKKNSHLVSVPQTYHVTL
jgi:copper chaperone CopZ